MDLFKYMTQEVLFVGIFIARLKSKDETTQRIKREIYAALENYEKGQEEKGSSGSLPGSPDKDATIKRAAAEHVNFGGWIEF